MTDPIARATGTTYDANGHVTRFGYDVRGHLTDTFFPDGTATHEEYVARGRRISMTGQMGKTTNVTHYTYDVDGDLASVTDANNHTTSREYDLLRRKTKRTLPLGQFETFAHNIAGRHIPYWVFVGVGHTLYCMLSLTSWETGNQGRFLEIPSITGPNDPIPALCGWRKNPIPGF